MTLYLTAKTSCPEYFMAIDYIEIKTKYGQTVCLTWDSTDYSRTNDGFSARYKGVYFDDEYANGRIQELEDLKILSAQIYVYNDEIVKPLFEILEMEFEDNGQTITITNPKIGEIIYE